MKEPEQSLSHRDHTLFCGHYWFYDHHPGIVSKCLFLIASLVKKVKRREGKHEQRTALVIE